MTDIAASYGSVGFLRSLGVRLLESQDGRVVGEIMLSPEHLNRAGVVHGGVLCTMIDFAACAAGLHTEPGQPTRLGVTLSLTTQFMLPAKDGKLSVEGRVTSTGRRTFTGEAHVRNASGELVASGIGTFQWREGSEPVARPGPGPGALRN